MSDLESGDAVGVYQYDIEPQLNDFASPAFEAICREYIRKKNRRGELPYCIAKLGRWWGKINIVASSADGKGKLSAVDSKATHYILGECKFRNELMDSTEFAKLKEKSAFIKFDAKIQCMLFSKSGFTEKLHMQEQEDRKLSMVSLEDIVREQ